MGFVIIYKNKKAQFLKKMERIFANNCFNPHLIFKSFWDATADATATHEIEIFE